MLGPVDLVRCASPVDGLQQHVGVGLVVGPGLAALEGVVGGHQRQQFVGGAEVDGLRLGAFPDAVDARVVAVEDHRLGGGLGVLREHLGGGVDLTEPVELVAHHVEEQAHARLDLADEMHGPGLVEFQDCDVGIELAAPGDQRKQLGDHATGEVRSGAVGEHLVPDGLQQFGDHLRGGGLAVGTRDQHDATGEGLQGAPEVSAIHPLDHQPGQRRTTAPQSCHPFDELPDHGADGVTRHEGNPSSYGSSERSSRMSLTRAG